MPVEFLATRRLIDTAWVAAGCPGSPPDDTNVDDTIGTYASNYLIFVIGVTAAIAFHQNTKEINLYYYLYVCFFVFTALGYGIAGIYHQVVHYEQDERLPKYKIPLRIGYCFVILGNNALGLLGNHLLPCTGHLIKILDGIITIICTSIFIEMIIDSKLPSLLLVGVLSVLVTTYLMIVWATKRKWFRSIGMFLCLVGFIVQTTLADKCIRTGYQNCFADCPLPAAYFNHNALFHVLYAIGFLIVGISMYLDPDQLTGDTRDKEATLDMVSLKKENVV